MTAESIEVYSKPLKWSSKHFKQVRTFFRPSVNTSYIVWALNHNLCCSHVKPIRGTSKNYYYSTLFTIIWSNMVAMSECHLRRPSPNNNNHISGGKSPTHIQVGV